MRLPNHYDEAVLSELLKQQQTMAWNALDCVDWADGVNFDKFFLPLDDDNIAFPKATDAQRRVISQYMGMMVASVFAEMEKAINRLKEDCWTPLIKKHGTSPELIALGENFFKEEAKHAVVFDHFISLCAKELNVDVADLKTLLPKVKPGIVEKTLIANAKLGGVLMWWIVATVEEESQLIFRQMKPHRDQLDKLHYDLHQRHFEEEARHAPYAFIMLDLGSHSKNPVRRADYIVSEVLKSLWLFFELGNAMHVDKLKTHNRFFKTLSTTLGKLSDMPKIKLAHNLASQTPYISTFINPLYHPYLKKEMINRKMLRLPLPEPKFVELRT